MFFQQVHDILQLTDVVQKCQATQQLFADWQQAKCSPDHDSIVMPIGDAGRPQKPQLVAPRDVLRRTMNTEQGRVILAHALAHIEFNAINLALDAVYRFRYLPDEYYGDWLRVAAEEAYHFGLLRGYLQQHQHDYGDFAAHNGLWELAQKTSHDVMVRMALVPRVMEARGLDVTPGLMHKLQQAGDHAFVAHLEIIHRDEIGHVTIGSRWFRYVCAQRGLDARATFRQLIEDYMYGSLKGPFDEVVRIQAGFSEEEMADLRAMEL
jgi:uncharacterized ferritin-like protein (DUF455 family)